MGPFQEAGPCFIDSIMKHLNIKRMPTYSQQVARLLRVWTDLNSILWKSSKKKSMDVLTLSSLQTFESRMTMDVNQRKILVDEVQKIERNGVYDVRNALSARFISEGILSLRATIIPSRFGTLWRWLFPSFLGGGGYKLAATSHTILSLWPRWVYIPKAERRNATRRFSSQPRECVRNLDIALSAVNAFP